MGMVNGGGEWVMVNSLQRKLRDIQCGTKIYWYVAALSGLMKLKNNVGLFTNAGAFLRRGFTEWSFIFCSACDENLAGTNGRLFCKVGFCVAALCAL